MTDRSERAQAPMDCDVVVVGAGMGGIYALHRLRSAGLKVVGVEAASDFGGVWFHNRYPGARVDLDSLDYSFQFSAELFAAWRWKERYAAQPELLEYLNFVADRLDIRRDFLLDTQLRSATWDPERCRYSVLAGARKFFSRFLVMATGNLSSPRVPDFPGLQDFNGELLQTSRWPENPVDFRGKRVAVIGTGSTGVQAVPVIAEEADQLFVLQRSPNFSVPARNAPSSDQAFADRIADFSSHRAKLFSNRAGVTPTMEAPRRASEYSPQEQLERMERQWALGGQGMSGVFADQGTDLAVNHIVAEFVRNKIRATVQDAKTAELLCPKDHPIGSRRLCLDIGYYESYNRDNVTLVDLLSDPIERFTASGIQTATQHLEVDIVVLALGFDAFSGVIDRLDIRNGAGESLSEHWRDGPKTYLGLMSAGFPNLFMPTAPGSPSVLANLFLMNEYHVDWIASAIAHMDALGSPTIEPTSEAEARWADVVAAASTPLLRLQVRNYMVKVRKDGSRLFMPYTGGLPAYIALADQVAANNYEGFVFGSDPAVEQHRKVAV